LNDSRGPLPTNRNVSKAIARSRAVRASAVRRRRRRFLLAACVATVAGAPIAWFMAEPAAAVVASVSDQARDLADLLGQRSPGTRTQAELTKHARIAAKTRAQPKPAPHQPAADAPKTAQLVDLLSTPPLAPVAVVAEGLAPPMATPPTLNAIVGSTPVITSSTPPTDGGSPVHFPTSEPRDNVPPSAVPEPGTWAMMLFGFGLVGWRMRRRPASRIKLA
jgi:hypothetical protein